MKEKKNILVTWDFTSVSENAFQHGLKMARTIENGIRLLHVVKEDKHLATAEKKLQKETARLSAENNYPIESVLLKGSIFNEISKYTTEVTDISLVVMGTHGIKGRQKYFGSNALRVIVGSPVPFVVVQDPPENMDKVSNIVFPVDFKSETKEKLQWAIFMGKYFNAKVHIFKSPISDKSLAKKVNTNLNFTVRFLIQNNLDYEIHTARKNGNFNKQILEFSNQQKTDMILVTTTKHITFFDYLLGAPEQYVLANTSRIPIMVINPKASFTQVGQFMYGN